MSRSGRDQDADRAHAEAERILADVEARRHDPEFLERLARRVEADRPGLDLLAGGEAGQYPTDDASPIGRVEKPWGYELRIAFTEHYAGKILHIRRGAALSVHLHRSKHETSYLVTGRLMIENGWSEHELMETEATPGYSWHIRPGEIHSIEALEDSVVFEVSTPHRADAVRLRDRYGRPTQRRPDS